MQLSNISLLSPPPPPSSAEPVSPPQDTRFQPATIIEVSEQGQRALDVSDMDDFEESVIEKVESAASPAAQAYRAASLM